jgi:hypothetical protein
MTVASDQNHVDPAMTYTEWRTVDPDNGTGNGASDLIGPYSEPGPEHRCVGCGNDIGDKPETARWCGESCRNKNRQRDRSRAKVGTDDPDGVKAAPTLPQEALSPAGMDDQSSGPPGLSSSFNFVETAISLANQIPYNDVSVVIRAAGVRIHVRPDRKQRR